MAKEKEKEADVSSSGQSKRPAPKQLDSSDSQVSGDGKTSHQQSHHQNYRVKPPKHVIHGGGGGGGRLHTRGHSSKALQKQAAKLVRRQTPPSPDPEPDVAPSNTNHRSTSDVKLSRDSSSSNLKKNHSQSSIRRNRSSIEVGKRNKSSTQLNRSASNPAVNKLKNPKSQVHFDLGDDQDDEWVDASGSASPYLSRRGSVAGSVQSSAKPPASTENSPPKTPPQTTQERDNPNVHVGDATSKRKEYLTSRLLQRTPSHGAPPKMSTEMASVPPHPQSPDSALSRQSSALSAAGVPTNAQPVQSLVGSGGRDELTSRFVHNSHGSGLPSDGIGSFNMASTLTRPIANVRPVNGSEPRRPRSMGNLADRSTERASLTDDEDDGAFAHQARQPRRPAGFAPPAEKSRTQQKLNLQRASSSIEPGLNPHPVGVAGAQSGPLVGLSGFDSRDPRVSRLLDRTGMEYLVVRRYQNPVARSIARLSKLPGADKNRRIPDNTATVGHAKRVSEVGGAGRPGQNQGMRDNRDSRDPRRPATPRRAHSRRPSGAGSAFGGDGGGGSQLHEGLSGSSLVDGEEDDGTVALLRNLWEKNLDLSASQD